MIYPESCPSRGKDICKFDELHAEAWQCYLAAAKNGMDQRDCWCDLPPYLQRRFMSEARAS